MNTVIRHIEYLLSRRECVIVPGFGAFLAGYEHAVIDADHGTVLPPRRVFSFNRELSNSNDGTLKDSVARAESISYEEASQIVDSLVDAMLRQMRIQGELAIGRVGRILYDSDTDLMDFEPYANDRISVVTPWLPAVEKEPEQDLANVLPLPQPNRWSRFVRIAASIAILIGIWFLSTTPISVNNVALASLSPDIKQPSAPQLPIEAAPALEDIIAESSITAYTSHKNLYVDINPQVPIANSNASSISEYVIIVGSFANSADANVFISQNSKTPLHILEKDGRFRVYSQAFLSSNAAYAAIARGEVPFSDAWVCKK